MPKSKFSGIQNQSSRFSRPEFIKHGGTVMFVAGSGLWLPTNHGQATALDKVSSLHDIPASRGYLLVDIHKCQGCMSCMLACSLAHEGVSNPALARIQIIQNPFESFPDDIGVEQCRQCVAPACVEACPEDALKAHSEYGYVRMLNQDKCIGCGACFEACPFKPSRITGPATQTQDAEATYRKCDLCARTPFHWDAKGGGPNGKQACVEICPVKTIQFMSEIPKQDGNKGYKVNLRDQGWRQLGY